MSNTWIDGYETKEDFIIRLYTDPNSIWVYWPSRGKVTFYTDTPEQAKALFEALRAIKLGEDEK